MARRGGVEEDQVIGVRPQCGRVCDPFEDRRFEAAGCFAGQCEMPFRVGTHAFGQHAAHRPPHGGQVAVQCGARVDLEPVDVPARRQIGGEAHQRVAHGRVPQVAQVVRGVGRDDEDSVPGEGAGHGEGRRDGRLADPALPAHEDDVEVRDRVQQHAMWSRGESGMPIRRCQAWKSW